MEERYYDETHQRYYYYNKATGESRWDDDAANHGSSSSSAPNWRTYDGGGGAEHAAPTNGGAVAVIPAAAASPLARAKEQAANYTAYIAAQQSNQEYSDGDDDEGDDDEEKGSNGHRGAASTRLHSDAAGHLASREPPKRKKSKRGKGKGSGGGSGDDDDTTSLLNGEQEDTQKQKLPTQKAVVYATTQVDICCYSFWIFLNAALLEGPLAAAEGCVRAGLFFAAAALALLPALVFRHADLTTFVRLLVREGLLSLAAAATLAVPFMACTAYRRYRMDVDWALAPLPSVLGWVDSRRFAVLTYGNGSFACNVRYDQMLVRQDGAAGDGAQAADGDVDGANGPVFHDVHGAGDPEEPSSKKKKKRKQARARARGAEGWPCEDTWPGAILLEPRRVHINLVLIVRGDDPLNILGS